MKKEFDYLVSMLDKYDLYIKDDEVNDALTALRNKIEEVEKRIECAVKSNAECSDIVLQLADGFQDEGMLGQTLSAADFEILQRGVHDVDIALDLNDTECIDNNWYGLWSEVGFPEEITVEYDFPEEVYTIGNADNTEIIGDVYESNFHVLLDLGIIVTENDNGFTVGKANYIVLDDKFIFTVKKKQIDLSQVPIKKQVDDVKSLRLRFEGYSDEDLQIFNGDNEETLKNWNRKDAIQEAINSVNREKQIDDSPTMQCSNTSTFDKVKSIIEILKTIDSGDCVDGETFSYIVSELGFEDYLLRYLIMSRPYVETSTVLEEKVALIEKTL